MDSLHPIDLGFGNAGHGIGAYLIETGLRDLLSHPRPDLDPPGGRARR